MTLDEAIAHAKEVAERNRRQWKNCPADRREIAHQTCEQCAEQHEQLAMWLEDYKRLSTEKEQDIYERAYQDGYNKGYDQGRFNGYYKAIDDFVVKSDELSDASNLDLYCKATIREIAVELKEKSRK